MSIPCWVVKEVHPQKDYTMIIFFADGSKKVYNACPLLEKKIYSQLKSLPFFMQAKASCGTVVWNDDIDIAPEFLYEQSITINE